MKRHNFHTRKLGEITAFYAVVLSFISTNSGKTDEIENGITGDTAGQMVNIFSTNLNAAFSVLSSKNFGQFYFLFNYLLIQLLSIQFYSIIHLFYFLANLKR